MCVCHIEGKLCTAPYFSGNLKEYWRGTRIWMELARIDANDNCRKFDAMPHIYNHFYISYSNRLLPVFINPSSFQLDRISLQASEFSANILYPVAICSASVGLWAMQLEGTGHSVTNCSAVRVGVWLKWLITHIL